MEIKKSSLGPVAPKFPEKAEKKNEETTEAKGEVKEGTEKDVEELREHIKAGIREEVKPETPIDLLYEKYLKDNDENGFITTLLEMRGFIAIDPKESNEETLSYIFAEHPSYPKAQFVPIFETEERLNKFYGKDQYINSELPFDMLFTGLNGLGIMINPTSPYNFTLQWETVKAIGQMVEARRENEQVAVEDDYIEMTGNLELVEGMESERQKYIDLLRTKLEYYPEIVRAYIEIVREVPQKTQNEEEKTTDATENKLQTIETKTEPQNKNTTPENKPNTETETDKTKTNNITTENKDTITEIENSETTHEIQSGEPHPLVIVEVSEETGDKLFGSIVKQLVKSIEDSAPAHRFDVARYVPAHHDEFLGDTEPFYYGLFQKPKPLKKFVKAPLPFQPVRKRVGRVSSKPSEQDQKNCKKGAKKK